MTKKLKCCVNCGQRIVLTHTFTDMNGKTYLTYRHYRKGDNTYYCEPADVFPEKPPPACHVCRTTSTIHGHFCSAAGIPMYHAELAND
jgi:hypothetical protein